MISKFKQDLLSNDESVIYSNYILGSTATFLENDSTKYDNFRRLLAKKLSVSLNDVGVVGSAKVGFSLNPAKHYKQFNAKSDIDLVIVSRTHFEECWGNFRKIYFSSVPIPKLANLQSSVFRKFVIIRDSDSAFNNPFLNDWVKSMDTFKRDIQSVFGIYNTINYRIYESWRDVEDYHVFGLNILKRQLENNEKSQKITSEK